MNLRPRGRGLPAGAIALFVALACLVPGAATAAPSPLLHDIDLVNGHLRVAIETAPEELGEALGTAEVVCRLGERAVDAGEAEAAAADWSTLGQLVDRFAVGANHRVDVAFANADATLRSLRERYELRWEGEPRLRTLRRAVHTTRQGIRIMRSAMAGLEAPFAGWRAHECAVANTGVEATFRRIPTGLRLIDLGMLDLWRLSGLLPSPTEGN
jgi:uncharacterized protein (DUF1810 family)